MLADSATFRTLVGAADQAAALTHIYRERLPDPAHGDTHTREELEALRPYAVVELVPGQSVLEHEATSGGSFDFGGRGQVRVTIERDVPAAYIDADDQVDLDAAEADWEAVIDGILTDLTALCGGADYLAARQITVAAGPYNWHPQYEPKEGRFQGVVLELSWNDVGV